MSQTPPEHILFLFVDQLRADCIGGFGHPIVQTPCLDQLLADGVGFRRVVTQSPLCVPARMSLFTGRYVHQHRCFGNRRGLWPESPNIVRAMRDAGYLTACRGKLHLFWRHDNELLMSDPMLRQFGFVDPMETTGKCSEGRLRASAYTEFLRQRGHLEAHWKWLWDAVRNRRFGTTFEPSILDEDEQQDGWIMDRGRELVSAGLDGERPLFAWIGPEGPHDPFDPPGRWANLYDPADVDLPLNQMSEDPFAKSKAKDFAHDTSDEHEVRRMRALYYGNISFIDHKLGQIIGDLKARSAYEHTWIVVASDHGEMLGDFRCTGKQVFHRQAVEVPLIIKPPARLTGCPRGTVSDALVELIDLGSTFMDIANTSLDGDQGRSLLPIIAGHAPTDSHRRVVHSQLAAYHLAQTDTRKLIYRAADREQPGGPRALESFFDLEQDPQEVHNVLDDRREEAEAFYEAHEPAFYAASAGRMPEPWSDQAPYSAWGRHPLLEALDLQT